MKHIVFIIDHLYLHGGAEKVVTHKANYFVETFGYKVTIVTSEQKNKVPCYALNNSIKIIDLGIDYVRDKSYFSIANLKKIPSHFYKQYRILKSLNPDCIIVVNYSFDFYWIPFIFKNKKTIKEYHSSRYFETIQRQSTKSWHSKLKWKIIDYVESKYKTLVVLNDDEKQFYNSKSIVVIPNSIAISSYKSSLQKKQVIAMGRIAPVKGFDVLIDVWAKVHSIHPDWQLHIYGEDYLNTQSELQQKIDVYKLSEVIHFKGTTQNATQTFLDYSVYAMTSVTECFPMVLLEALSVGLPIVSFDCPTGPRHIISNNKSGYLIPNGDQEKFATRIIELLNNAQHRKEIGDMAYKNIRSFEHAIVMNSWKNLIES